MGQINSYDYRMHLQVVADSRNLARYDAAIGEAHTRDFTQPRIRLAWRLRPDFDADALFLRASFKPL